MPGITALTILLTIYGAGEMIAKKTKAVFSTVLGIAILLLIGFWTGILPETIFQTVAWISSAISLRES